MEQKGSRTATCAASFRVLSGRTPKLERPAKVSHVWWNSDKKASLSWAKSSRFMPSKISSCQIWCLPIKAPRPAGIRAWICCFVPPNHWGFKYAETLQARSDISTGWRKELHMQEKGRTVLTRGQQVQRLILTWWRSEAKHSHSTALPCWPHWKDLLQLLFRQCRLLGMKCTLERPVRT
jgi:hypothetical protein